MNRILKYKALIEKDLEELASSFKGAKTINDAMSYSLLVGGKRIRPLLVLTMGEFLGIPIEELMPMALSMEMIHTYSLIHDDLPAMDNDDLRRGKATNHKVFGEAIAILAGDGLLNEAFNILITKYGKYPNGPEAILEITKSSGILGMISGQVLDIEGEGKKLDLIDLKKVHLGKTGALIRASLKAPAILKGLACKDLDLISQLGEKLGILFQIQDDILDATESTEKLGKTAGKDDRVEKSTYVTLLGLEGARREKEQLHEEIKKLIFENNLKASSLEELLDKIYKRDY